MMDDLGSIANGTLRVLGLNVSSEQGERFRARFETCWLVVPEDARRELESYWRKRSVPQDRLAGWHGLRDHQPCVVLTAYNALPQCDQAGHVLAFSACILDEMGEELAVKAIAHEVAHAVLYARGDDNHWSKEHHWTDTRSRSYQAAEAAVDELLRTWKVDQADLLRWRDAREAMQVRGST